MDVNANQSSGTSSCLCRYDVTLLELLDWHNPGELPNDFWFELPMWV